MLVEWFFLMSVMSGPFDPATESGWQSVERSRHSFATLAECQSETHRLIIYYRTNPIQGGGGGGVIITGCQPWHTQ